MCPPKLCIGLFTTGVVDNVDHDPSSTTAKDSFHGTRVSLVQHPSHTNGGIDRDIPVTNQGCYFTMSVIQLPSAYTMVRPENQGFSAPAVQGPVKPTN